MNPLQLDFFDETSTDLEKLVRRFDEVEKSSSKVRRGIFAKHSDLAKKYMELNQRLEIIERNICNSLWK